MASKPLCLVSAGHQARRRETNHRKGIQNLRKNVRKLLYFYEYGLEVDSRVTSLQSQKRMLKTRFRFLYLDKVLINLKINALIVTATQIATKIGRVQNDNLIINQWPLYPQLESMI